MDYNWKQIEEDVQLHREELIDRLVDFSLYDVLLYWSTDKKLQKEQEKKWGPVLQWVDENVNARFKTTTGLESLPSTKETSLRLRNYISSFSDKELAAFSLAAVNMRSVLLALALVRGHINANEAFKLSELEELYQIQKWGKVPEAEERRKNLKSSISAVEKYLQK